MRKLLFLLTIFCCISVLSQKKTPENNDYFFYENKGQIVDQNGKANPDVKYLFHSAGLNVQLRTSGFSYDVYETKKTTNPNSSKFRKEKAIESKTIYEDEFLYENHYHRIDIELVNSNRNAILITEGKSKDYDNYYNIPYKPEGITSVHRFRKVTYKNIYPNIDLVFFKPKDTLKPVEYNFIIQPGGKISDIKMKFNGAPTSIMDKKLLMKVRFGNMFENIPNSWIEGDTKENIDVSFKDLGDQVFGFNAPFETADRKIIIDPVPTRVWGSNAGGSGEDYGKFKTDSQNRGYLFGATNSYNNIATAGTYQQNVSGALDAFIMKLTTDGQKLWGTYYGFGMTDVFTDIDFDENFNIYIGGTVERSYYNTNIALVKLNTNGVFIFQKEFVAERNDKPYSISYSQNKVYVGGESFSADFPTVNAMQPVKSTPIGYTDGILACLDSTTGNVDWATYFGQSDGSTTLFQIMSSANDLEIIGSTLSSNIPMINAFQPVKGGDSDGIYLKFSKTGNTVLRSSYFGNAGQEFIMMGNIVNNVLILPGRYSTPSFPLGQPGIWRVNLSNNNISKSYFNFYSDFQLLGYPDNSGNVFFTNLHTNGQPDISTPGAYMGMPPQYVSTFVIKYNQNDVKEWGTYYTGNGATQHGEITRDNEGSIYLTGMSNGNTTGMATPGTFQQLPGGGTDIFVAKFRDCTSPGIISSNAPICINATLQLNATGGSSYSWTGPNGFTSTLQNPSIPNATAANSGIYTCQISGTGSCDGSFTVHVTVGDTAAPVPTLAALPHITGDCHTVVSDIPTATDNCAGTITATTTDPLSYSLPGTYVIHWTYHDGNGNSSAQNQNVTVTAPALPAATAVQTFCATNLPEISDLQATGQSIKWYDAAGNLLAATVPLVNGQTYYASQTINGCESNKTAVQAIVNDTPKPSGNATQDFCASANPTLANLAVTGNGIRFYNAAGTLLPLTTPLIHGMTYFATQTFNACESEKLAITVTLSTDNVPAHDYAAAFCNSNTGNSMTVNLMSYQQDIIANPVLYTFAYTDASGNPIGNPAAYSLPLGTTIIHVKVMTPDGCFKVVRLNLTLHPKPNVELPERMDFCDGKSITLDAGAGYSSYLWNTGATTQTISVSAPGTYSVTVTNSSGCQNTDTVQVSYTALPEITAVNISNSTAAVILSAAGSFEYSLDNLVWQDSNVFTNLSIGEYTVYVRTKGGCIVGRKKFSIFDIPNAFTPNADGYNDHWNIQGLENYPGTEINVYDRRGLPVFREIMTKKSLSWDGKLNGNPLPTGNYWYTIKVSDGRVFTGWLLIKNRE